mgnify:CR=1 FL=1
MLKESICSIWQPSRIKSVNCKTHDFKNWLEWKTNTIRDLSSNKLILKTPQAGRFHGSDRVKYAKTLNRTFDVSTTVSKYKVQDMIGRVLCITASEIRCKSNAGFCYGASFIHSAKTEVIAEKRTLNVVVSYIQVCYHEAMAVWSFRCHWLSRITSELVFRSLSFFLSGVFSWETWCGRWL